MFTPGGYAIAGGKEVQPGASAMMGIADTGTTLMLVDATIAKAYYKKVSGSSVSNTYGGYVFNCDATLPDFVLYIGGYAATVPGEYINYAPNGDGSESRLLSIFSDD